MILVNGVLTDLLPVQDRGFQYGDGLFETLAIRDGRPLYWLAHMERLAKGCAVLGIPAPPQALLAAEADRLCKDRQRCVLRITVSRGCGGRGYGPPPEPESTRVLAVHDWPVYPRSCWSEGISVFLCHTRLGHQPQLAGLKHLNRLEQVLARKELAGSDHPEGLMLDITDRVIEGTMSNLFLIRGKELLTADLRNCGVAGIVRARILERAGDWGLTARVGELSLADVYAAEEAFFTNSVIGVWPARRIGSRDYPPALRSREISRSLAAEDCIVPP